MKLTKRDISAYLKQPAVAHRAVLFFGPDEGQVGLYRKQALAALLSNPADAMSITHLANDKVVSDPSLLFQALSAMSLLGDAPVVILDPATDKLAPIIKQALAMPECQNFLLLCAGELTPRSALRLLFEKEKNLAAFACYRDEGADLQRFLETEFRNRSLRADRDAMNYLLAHLGNDRAVTLQEIEKISLYLNEGKSLTLEDAMLLVGGIDNFSLDEFCLALGNAHAAKVFSLAQKLVAEGTNLVTLLRTAIRHYERLKLACQFMQQGKNADDAMDMLQPPVFYKSKPAFKKQLSSLDNHKIIKTISVLLNAEIQIKRGGDAHNAAMHAFTQSCLIAA